MNSKSSPARRFPIHLCQPDGEKSCAACCGIYNFKDISRQSLTRRLRRNTRALERSRGTFPARLTRHTRLHRSRDNGFRKRFSTLYNCEFVGFLDPERRLVGCLLHPEGNDGRDWRDFSFYGRELCEGHFCLSYYYLSVNEQKLVIDSISDWYLYGLVITDIDLVKGVIQALSDRIGETLPVEALRVPTVRSALLRFWTWKLFWPFRRKGTDHFGKYLFKGENYEEIKIPYHRWGRKSSPHHRILTALGSHFRSSEDLDAAERMISQEMDAFVRTYETALSQEIP